VRVIVNVLSMWCLSGETVCLFFLINDKYEIKQVVANSVPRQIKIAVTGNKMYRSFV